MTEQPRGAVSLRFEVKEVGPITSLASIVIPADTVEAVFNQAIQSLQKTCHAQGFSRGNIPAEYVVQNFSGQLKKHAQEFCFNYFALPFLYESIRNHSIVIAGTPQLIDMHVARHQEARYNFQVYTLRNLQLRDWKYLPFKPPRRKRYKDLDRQAEQFIKAEQQLESEIPEQRVALGDWVRLSVMPMNHEHCPLFGEHTENVWLKIGNDEADKEWRDVLIGKKVGDHFSCNNDSIQSYFCGHSTIPVVFNITISDVICDSYFCLEQFKKYFRIKTKKDMVQKFVEVFSYQHDISQRRAIAERSLELILIKNKFEIPQELLQHQQESVLNTVKNTPDYYVYRTQKDFHRRIEQLARKQTAEMIVLDQIACDENIATSPDDIRYYFNLIKRPRTKEFIYFSPPITRLDGQELPLYQEELALHCLREKTLNYVIHHLTRL